MLEALANLFSYIVQPCYDATGSWWMAILLFTVIIKIILMPLSLWCQWNSIVMETIMPDLNRIKVNLSFCHWYLEYMLQQEWRFTGYARI